MVGVNLQTQFGVQIALLAQVAQALLKDYAINKNNDNEIQCSEAKAYIGKINVGIQNISDLTGIEEFVNLTELYCNNNNLTTLDVSKNTRLTKLYCHITKLTTLDVSKNTNLTELDCSYTKLTTLDVSKNTRLTKLYCEKNNLTTLDLSKNTKLTRLLCEKNPKLTCIKIAENFTPPNGWSKPTNAVWSTNCATASINNETFTSAITIYPNPANNVISVNSNIKLSRVDIFTLLGRNVISSSEEKINISNLNSGLYVVRIINVDNKITTKKIMVVK